MLHDGKEDVEELPSNQLVKHSNEPSIRQQMPHKVAMHMPSPAIIELMALNYMLSPLVTTVFQKHSF